MIALRGNVVLLRDLTSADTSAVHAIVGDSSVTKWLSFDARDREEAAAMVAGVVDRQAQEPRTEYYLAVCAAGGELVGFCRLGLSGVQAAKLGYAIRPDTQGCGYATDACRTILRFAFRDLGLHRVSAAVGPDNLASVAVLRKLGFQHEGRLRDHVHTNGAWRDSDLFSLLAAEYEQQHVASEGPAAADSRPNH